MNSKPQYFDRRADFWRSHFESALSWKDYLTSGDPDYAKQWEELNCLIPPLTKEEKSRLGNLNRQLNILVYCGFWCGDCVRQGPMLHHIASAGSSIDLRFIDRESSEELQDECRILGALRVPIVIFLSEDYHEVTRFGDRHLSVYRTKLRRDRGEITTPPEFPPPKEELGVEQNEWIDLVERALIMLQLAPPLRARHKD